MDNTTVAQLTFSDDQGLSKTMSFKVNGQTGDRREREQNALEIIVLTQFGTNPTVSSLW